MYHVIIEKVFRKNLESRYMEGVYLPHMFKGASDALANASHIAIVTGFVVKEAEAGETDGPPGALMMAKCFEQLGVRVSLITDAISERIMKVGMASLSVESDLFVVDNVSVEGLVDQLLVNEAVSHLIGIERPSRAKDQECYSMRGEVITDYVANTDILFHRARALGITTIGIGDGGNEVGMGSIRDYVHKNVPKGDLICATTEVDYLIIGGVSNWVAYGICGAISINRGKMLIHEAHVEEKLIEDIVAAGAVDGMAKKAIPKVDGVDMAGNLEILNEIREIVYKFISK